MTQSDRNQTSQGCLGGSECQKKALLAPAETTCAAQARAQSVTQPRPSLVQTQDLGPRISSPACLLFRTTDEQAGGSGLFNRKISNCQKPWPGKTAPQMGRKRLPVATHYRAAEAYRPPDGQKQSAIAPHQRGA